jgi:putative transcriptional regulator
MPPEEDHRVEVHLDKLLAARGITLTELADRVGLTLANLSILKNGRARAIRFSTLTALCDVLDCRPGDLFSVLPAGPAPGTERARRRR